MKISEGTLHNIIFTGEWVLISSESIDTHFEVIYVDNTIRVQATTYDGAATGVFQDFVTFRNGTTEYPDMEHFLDK